MCVRSAVLCLLGAVAFGCLSGCGSSNSPIPNSSPVQAQPSQALSPGVYYNPTSEPIAVYLDGLPNLIFGPPSSTASQSAQAAIPVTSPAVPFVPLKVGDTVGNVATKITVLGCFSHDGTAGNTINVCYDSADMESKARVLAGNMDTIVPSVKDLVGDPGNVNVVLTKATGKGDISGTYDASKRLAMVHYNDDFTVLMIAAHELGHAAFANLQGTTEPIWLNELVATWTGANYFDLMVLGAFDTGALYEAPLTEAGYTRLYAASQLIQQIQVLPLKEALLQDDVIKALTGLDQEAFSRKFWLQYRHYIPVATYGRYVEPYGTIRLAGTGVAVGTGKLQTM